MNKRLIPFFCCFALAVIASSSHADGPADLKAALKLDKGGARKAALGLYTQAIKSGELQSRDLENAYYRRAMIYLYRSRNLDAAIRDLSRAIDIRSKTKSALYWQYLDLRAQAYRSRAFERNSEKDLDRAFADQKRMVASSKQKQASGRDVELGTYCTFGCDSGAISCRKLCIKDSGSGLCGQGKPCSSSVRKCYGNCTYVRAVCSRWCLVNRR